MTPPVTVRRDLIFDLGLYEGQDSRFYLDKGFTVVAVEANPHYAGCARLTFAREIAEGRFYLVERAIWSEGGLSIQFHTRGAQSSIIKEFADSGGASLPVDVLTTTLEELFSQYGVPYYLKCDLEGVDGIAIAQIQTAKEIPDFVSVEASSADAVEELACCGYDRFQIINQGYHASTKIPFPPREGIYRKVRMNDTMTGLFGRELNERRWMSKEEALAAMKHREFILSPGCGRLLRYFYRRVGKITGHRHLIAQGWIDIHACRKPTLKLRPTS
jgi:FkbM family methyltransferase